MLSSNYSKYLAVHVSSVRCNDEEEEMKNKEEKKEEEKKKEEKEEGDWCSCHFHA